MKTWLILFISFLISPSILPSIENIGKGQSLGLSFYIPSISIAHAAGSELKAGMIDPKTGKKIKYWAAPMDPTYIRNEPGKSPMGMDLVPVYEDAGGEKEPASTIRIDPVTVQNMGVRLGRVEKKSLTRSVRAFGVITYNETTLYAVNTKFNGWIEKLHVNFEGEKVTKGQPLFDIYSPELFAAQQEYLLALQQHNSLTKNRTSSVVKSTDRLLEAARTRLRFWDLSEDQITSIEKTAKLQKTLTIRSPADGVIIKKSALAGHYVKAGAHQYEIADLSTVWVDVDVYEYEFPWIQKGMPAEMNLSYIPGKKFKGKVLFIYPYLDSKTRTVKLRLMFDNQDQKLKPGMYANVYLKPVISDNTLVIPQEAVIDSGVRKIVFVALGKGKFQPREVELGLEGNHYEVQVLSGLSEGERVVISGQFMLDSESRLKEAIQKMLDPRAGFSKDGEDDDLDMDDLSMESGDDMDMSEMTMDKAAPGEEKKP